MFVVGFGQSAGIGQMDEQEKSIQCNQIVVPHTVPLWTKILQDYGER